MKYFCYCPDCKMEEIVETETPFRNKRLGTDGYGQPVMFKDCGCGSEFLGFLNLNFYTRRGEEVNDGLLSYLKHRINFYYDGFKTQ